MKTVKCYNCKSNENKFYASENGYTLVKCSQCGLLFVNPRPNDIEVTQASMVGQHKGDNTINVTGVFQTRKTVAYLDVLSDFSKYGLFTNSVSWLDIGCGHGEFLVALKQFSNGKILSKGLEPNKLKQESAKKKYLDVSNFDLDKHLGRYDVISCLNVYSHLPDPPKVIEGWKKLLKKGGGILIETGDTANLSGKEHYKPYYLPDHLSFASEDIVVRILEKSGFEVKVVNKYPLIRNDLHTILIEIIKLFWPKKQSKIMSIFKNKKTDMYIWASLKS